MKLYKSLTLVLLFSICYHHSFSQCGVQATVSKKNINCGESVTLGAIPNGLKPLNNDFNDGTIGSWQSAPGGVVTDGSGTYACMGPSPDPVKYFFMGSTSNTPRYLQSNPLDLKQGGAVGATACFYMKYSTQGQSGTCEGPDDVTEGVYLEYSTNCAGGSPTWTQIKYWNPNGGSDPMLTSWNQYCVAVPAAALTNSTCFRWIQKASSGTGFDTWAIDKVQIILDIPGYTYAWKHDGENPSVSPATPDVAPSVTTTYKVTYTNTASGGTDLCTSDVVVTVTKVQVTSTVDQPSICNGSSTTLRAASPFSTPPPSVCALSNPPQYCDALGSEIKDHTVVQGNYTYTSGNCNVNIFGASNCGGAVTSQMLYRVADLKAKGLVAGKITSLQFEVASGGGSYQNFRITMACTNLNALPSSFANIPSTVFNSKTVSIAGGWNRFDLDNYYDWDGKSNIIVQICYYMGSAAENVCYTKNLASGYASLSTSGTNGSGSSASWNCGSSSSFYGTYNYLPNTIMSECQPKNVVLDYKWSPSTGLSSTTNQNPVATPPSTSTYVVSAYPTGQPQCATTSTQVITVVTPTATTSPKTVTICPTGSTPSFASINVNGTTQGNATGSYTFTSATNPVTFADNNPTGARKMVNVSGMSPNSLGSNPILNLCVNVAMTKGTGTGAGDCGTRQLKLTLISPGGTSVVIYNGAVNAATLNGCFTANYALANPFPTSGAVNGTWQLKAEDTGTGACGTGGIDVNANGGTFTSWSLSFASSGTNDIVKYQWIPSTNLDDPTSQNPVVSTTSTATANTTYTALITDALGCTAMDKLIVATCNISLPLNLLSFNVSKVKNMEALCQWYTASEQHIKMFVVERSVDGKNFSELGRVNAKGAAIKTAYQYIDKSPAEGLNYYRLKMVEDDNASNYSNMQQMLFSRVGLSFHLMQLSPNPVVDELNYSVESETEGVLEVDIYTVDGKLIKHFEQPVQKGLNYLKHDMSALASGVYLLKASQSGSSAEIKRFVK